MTLTSDLRCCPFPPHSVAEYGGCECVSFVCKDIVREEEGCLCVCGQSRKNMIEAQKYEKDSKLASIFRCGY